MFGEWTVRALLLLTLTAALLHWAAEHLSREWTRPGREETLRVRPCPPRHMWGLEGFDSNNKCDVAGSSRGLDDPPPSVCSQSGKGATPYTFDSQVRGTLRTGTTVDVTMPGSFVYCAAHGAGLGHSIISLNTFRSPGIASCCPEGVLSQLLLRK